MTSPHSNRNIFVAVCILGAAILLPIPSKIPTWFGGVISQLVVPVSEPMIRIQSVIRPASATVTHKEDNRDSLIAQLELSSGRIARLEKQNATLKIQLEALQEGYQTGSFEKYQPVMARRAANTNLGNRSVFRINAGDKQHIQQYDVVISLPNQLVGRIADVASLTSVVIPITAHTADESQFLGVQIDIPDHEFSKDSLGTIEPQDDGTFAGFFSAADPIKIGYAVRLDDPAWGDAHTGLLVGYVTAIQPYDPNPLHVNVIVKPGVTLDRLSEVVVKVPLSRITDRSRSDDAQDISGAGGGG